MNLAESAPGTPDQITDFVSGTDRIDVTAVVAGLFLFNGTGAFSGGGTASVIYAAAGGNTDVAFDIGDGGAAEMVIRLTGTLTLAVGDFML